MNNIKYKYRNFYGLFGLSCCLMCLLFSCGRKDENFPLKTRTVIVYMVGDNNLDSYIESDINEMERGWEDSYDGNMIVYVDQKRVSPYILEISSDRSNSVVSKEVMKYSEQNSSSIEVMERVLSDIKSMYPAKSYGLIFWSHASGWLPASTTKVFGDDNGQYMEITDLAKLSGKYDFFIFDACDMMGIEVVYELRNNSDYIVGSVTDILGYSFPYDEISESLFMENADIETACQKFMEYYRSFPDIIMQTAAISIVKTENLEDIALVSRSLIQKYKNNIADVDISEIQKYDSNEITLFFDFLDFMENIAQNDPELQTLRDLLSTAVIFEDHTPTVLNEFEINRSCGLSCYILGQYAGYDYAYKNISWYKAVY